MTAKERLLIETLKKLLIVSRTLDAIATEHGKGYCNGKHSTGCIICEAEYVVRTQGEQHG